MWVQPIRSEVEQVPAREAVDHRVAVLLNANARKVGAKVLRALSNVLPQQDLFLSRSELDARRIAQQVVDRGYGTVFLGGGDGTVTCFINEIANQVALRRQHHPTPMPRFGVLKLGTGNSVASTVKASSNGDGVVDDVLRARAGEVPGYCTLDLLLIEGKRAPFAGLGVDGQILNDYNWVKQKLAQGPFSRLMSGPGGYFTSVAFKTVPAVLARSAEVECEVINGSALAFKMGPDGSPCQTFQPGDVMYRGPLMMAAAGTVPFYGFELKMFPYAGKRRGMMNLRIGVLPPTTIIANLPKLWNGTWRPDGLKDFLCKDATIKFSREMPFQIAGDAEGYRSEVHFAVNPEPVEVIDFTGTLH